MKRLLLLLILLAPLVSHSQLVYKARQIHTFEQLKDEDGIYHKIEVWFQEGKDYELSIFYTEGTPPDNFEYNWLYLIDKGHGNWEFYDTGTLQLVATAYVETVGDQMRLHLNNMQSYYKKVKKAKY